MFGIRQRVRLRVSPIVKKGFSRILKSSYVFRLDYYEHFNNLRLRLLNFYGTQGNLVAQNQLGVMHIGASFGQEAEEYSQLGLQVLWVEAIPEVFEVLRKRIHEYSNQRAICALLGDDSKEVEFKIASNSVSSSIYELSHKYSNYANFSVVNTLNLQMKKMSDVLDQSSLINFPYWVLDVQGAELLVLKGAGRLLDICQIIELEITNFNYMKDAPQHEEIHKFLESKGFFLALEVPRKFHGNTIYIRINTAIEVMKY